MIGEAFPVSVKYARIRQRQTHCPYFRQEAGVLSLRYSPVKGLCLPTHRNAANAFRSTAQLDAATPVRLTCGMPETEPDDDPARIGRRLLRRQQRGTLATSMRGAPYASLVLIAADLDASPLLLLSDLAQHSRNIAFDPRISLLIDGTAGYRDPLTGPAPDRYRAGQSRRGPATSRPLHRAPPDEFRLFRLHRFPSLSDRGRTRPT